MSTSLPSATSKNRPNRRLQRIRRSMVITVSGFLAVAAVGYRLQQGREADLRDTSDSVTVLSVAEVPASAPELPFVDVADQLGIRMRHGPGPRSRILPEDTGSGLAWGDIDGDGDFDLYVVNFPAQGGSSSPSGEAEWNRLFRNDGDRFSDLTAVSGTADPEGFGMGASFADFDDDGDVDLYVTNWGPNRLFRNRGDGTFEEVAAKLGVADPLWSVASLWGDFDRDGRLDLYVTNYVAIDTGIEELARDEASFDPSWQGIPLALNPNAFDPEPNRLYRQREDGSFEDVALTSGASNPLGRSLAATAVDLDGDGWLDLYVANDVSPNVLLRNLGAQLGEALFEDASSSTGTADPRGSMGIAVTDLQQEGGSPDGLPDLFVTHWVAQENALYQAVLADGHQLEYRDKTRHLGLGEISTERVGWGAVFADFDLDGRGDLAVANGSTLEDGEKPPGLAPQPLFLFWNTGDGFADLARVSGPTFAAPHNARGLAAADYDGDGDVDLAISINRGSPLLLRNDTATGHDWLAVRLDAPAARAFGARLELTSGELRQVMWWGSDVSFASGHAPEAVFGLGPGAGNVDLLVEWADGRRSEHLDVPPSQRITVDYPSKEPI
ncbi:MAG: CRTAC1 family protein [Deltaproteobacteria bacterium]|nr:CRTAC1 family protein [Deltaproteobacteria bacterium]